jgi:aryl-alcohol dehydrogenase
MKIAAAIAWEKDAPLVIEEVELDPPQADEILVKVKAVGICHTDLNVMRQQFPLPLPMILGHEGAGIVEAVGANVRAVKPGDRVGLTFDSCGSCRYCQEGQPAYCVEQAARNFTGLRADGSTRARKEATPIRANFFGQSSFATYALARERNVVKVPGSVPLEIVGPLGCGIMTGAGAVMNALKVQAGQSIVVLGAGAVGLSAVMAARLVGAGVIIAVDVHAHRLALARELGATHTVDAKDGSDIEPKLREIVGGNMEFVADTTGVGIVIRQAVQALATRGTCGLIGSLQGDPGLNFRDLMGRGKTVRGIIDGDSIPGLFIPRLIEYQQSGRFPFDRLIRKYEFGAINQAIADAAAGIAIKPVLLMP